MSCRKLALFFFIVLVAIVSIIGYKEHFSMELNKDLNIESCWKYINNTFNWNLDELDDGEKKVLLTMKKLNANTYEDNNKFFPGWENKCVIPKEHLPIFNKDINAKDEWDMYSDKPQQNSKGYMQYTNESEYPKGYVVDLKKHDEKSFKDFLGKAYELYDKEFFDEKKRLEEEIENWKIQRDQKKDLLKNIKREIKNKTETYNELINPNGECQKTKEH